ncbi:hypothetical protein [Desulfoluna butyratoxydans]|uniref:Hotdog domain n=1 Tax=Desulfoluna butyratoxydans TaxID=231438 RepID=A0A4U8YI02_9BACT|nr:hypothetical protein [Desulfoluna butyratoxydans]VFQ42887.1 hypothetical protein MSL71_5080 [Desulfoluna butyratoxydans]
MTQVLETPFLMLSRISSVADNSMTADSAELGGEPHGLLEAMAQCAAYHVRHVTGFSRQAFLMKVTRYPFPPAPVTGVVPLTAVLTGSATDARAYQVSAEVGGETVTASLLIGTTPYDDRFEAARLSPHYQEIFQCLTRA